MADRHGGAVCVCTGLCVCFHPPLPSHNPRGAHLYLQRPKHVVTWMEVTTYEVEGILKVILRSSHHVAVKYVLDIPILLVRKQSWFLSK